MTTSEQAAIKIDFNDALLSHLASSSINSLGYTPTMDAKSLQTPIYSAISIKEIRTCKMLKKMTLNVTNWRPFYCPCLYMFFRLHNKREYLLFRIYSRKVVDVKSVILLESKMNQGIIACLSLATYLRAYLHD